MIKYKIIILPILLVLGLIVNLILFDFFILPKKNVTDTIVEYSKIMHVYNGKFQKTTSLFGYKFYTEKGFEFSTDKRFIEETNVQIKHTIIFKNITDVFTENNDYSSTLMSDLNSVNLYFYIILSISTTTSILTILLYKNITENGFQNIVLFNLFMLFCIGIIYINT